MPKQTKTTVETPVPIQTESVAPKQKATKKVVAAAPVDAAALAPVTSTSEPVVAESKQKVKKVKAPKSEVVEPVAVAPVDGENVVVAPVDETTESALNELSIEFFAKLQQANSLISSLKADFRTLEKKYQREIKINQKKSSKRAKRSGTRAPSGFVKPTRISDELAKFLDKPTGSEMARTEVTRDINTYIRSHNLQDKANGRKINPDTKLASLLKLTDKDELTYFNLQRYMSPHFTKNVKPEVVVASV
jgi:hypothetical protein